MTMKRNDMQRMIIEGVRRLLCGGQPAQEAMGVGSTDHLTGVNRSLEPAQTAFSSGTDGRSSGKKRQFFRQRTAVLSAQNACSLGKEQQFPREEIFVPSGGNNIFLGRKPFFPRLDMSFSFPHLALRFLLVIVLILGGVLESGAATQVKTAQALKTALGNAKYSGNTVTLTDNVELSSTIEITGGDIILDLNGKNIYNKWKRGSKQKIDIFDITGGTLTIKGGGSVYNRETSDNSAIWMRGGTLVVENATIYSDKQTAIYMGDDNSTNLPVVYVKEYAKIYTNANGSNYQPIKAIKGSLSIQGGEVYRPEQVNKKAVGLYIDGASVLMSAGKIYGNSKGNDEAIGVEIAGGSFTLEGGEIAAQSLNVTELDGNNARGLNIIDGEVTLKSGTITAYSSKRTSYAISSSKQFSSICPTGYGVYKDGTLQVATSTSVLGTVTIEPIKYKFNYHTNGGSVADCTSTYYYTIENKNISLLTNIGMKAGYQFTGEWYYESNLTTKVTTSNLPFPTTDVVDVYAKWTTKSYTLKFQTNGGSTVSEQSYDVTKKITSLPTPTRLGYKFEGWYYDAGYTSKVTSLGEENTTNFPESSNEVTIYAKWEETNYTLKYETNGGSPIADGSYSISTNTLTQFPTNPIRTGYTFDRWYYDENLTQPVSLPLPETTQAYPSDKMEVTFYAKWNAIPYTLKLMNGDTSFREETIFNYSTIDLTFTKPIKEYYDFVGWFPNADGSGTQVTSVTNAIDHVTLYAKFAKHKYSIIYEFNNGTKVTGGNYPDTYVVGESVTLGTLTRNQDRFLGWQIEGSGTLLANNVLPANDPKNVSLVAVWDVRYTITFNIDADGLTVPDAMTPLASDQVKLPKPATEKRGYTFGGWKDNKGNTYNTTTSYLFSGADITLTAIWNPITYTVTFKDGSTELYTQTYQLGTGSEVEFKDQTKDGFIFNGWKDESGHKVTAISNTEIEDKTFVVDWITINYHLTYYFADNATADQTKVYTWSSKGDGLHIPVRTGYTFQGWFLDGQEEALTALPTNDKKEKDIYFEATAKWELQKYPVVFYLNDGSGAALSYKDFEYSVETGIPEKSMPGPSKAVRKGYTFAGWYTNPEGTGTKVTSIAVGTGKVELYAKWQINTYTIEYKTGGGTILSGKVDTYQIGDVVTLPTDVKRDGFTFVGWYANEFLSGDQVKQIQATEYGNKVFYAKWSQGFVVTIAQPKEGVISVKQGDQVIASGTPLAKGTELTISAAPTTSGYVLKQLVINGQAFTTSPQTVTMGEANLIISAEFVASTKPTVSAPTITTDPDREKVDAETLVKVTLAKTDAASTLYYALNNQQASPYSAPFVVDGGVGDTVTIRAIARREGYNDGITTRRIVFDGRLHLTFDLPAGVTATAPDGGAVVDAIVKGGTFEFKLQVDKSYFASTDSLQVMANDSLITPGSSGVYRLYDQKGDVKVVVKGLKAYTCVVTLLQTEHGQIAFAEGEEESSRTIAYGTELTLQATADEDYKFSKWSTGSQQNPLKLTVVSDTTLSATFVNDYKAYQITLPEVEGVTAKPFTGYSTEVKRDGTFKFYLVIANGYHEEQLVVRADGEELVKNKGGYALYHITKNIRISVEGIARDAFALTLPPNVQAWKLATMEEAAKASLYAETTLLLQAMAPEGQRFLKWTDGSTENPRTATALDAKQLYPLFTTLSEIPTAKVTLEQTAGAGITGATSNLDVANLGDQLSVKVVVLPAYSQSEVRLLANGQSVEPQARLRAASEAKSYYYQVPVAQADVKLKVEGLRLNQYQLTVAESTGGRVEGVPSGKVTHGDTVSLTAKAAEGMTFVRWWDGNTLNPYPYPVTGDQTIRAYFVGESSPVDNESVTAEEVRVCSPTTGGLWVELPVPQDIWLWDSSGRLLLHRFDSGTVRLAVPAGIYLLQCGMRPAFKVVVRQ